MFPSCHVMFCVRAIRPAEKARGRCVSYRPHYASLIQPFGITGCLDFVHGLEFCSLENTAFRKPEVPDSIPGATRFSEK
jgi:hypothetical protein